MNRADLTLLLIAAIWGTTFALLRDTMRILHPTELMAVRFSIATLLLGTIYWKRLVPVRRRWLLDGLWLGVWLSIGYLTQVFGLLTITASRSAFITGTYVVFTPFLVWVLLRIRPALGEFLGVAVVFTGLTCFAADLGFSLSPGDLWTLGCALAFGTQIVITNIVGKRSDPIALSVVQMGTGAIIGWLFVGARGGMHTPWERIPWGVMIYLAVVATALVIALQTWALARTTSVKAALLFSTEPIFAALFAAAFFAERMTSREILGAALILAGVFVSELWRPAMARLSARGAPVISSGPGSSRAAEREEPPGGRVP
jgi:drug/metabolite transporter (DMT)-like permease